MNQTFIQPEAKDEHLRKIIRNFGSDVAAEFVNVIEDAARLYKLQGNGIDSLMILLAELSDRQDVLNDEQIMRQLYRHAKLYGTLQGK